MSIRDFISNINEAYKGTMSQRQGHNLDVIAERENGITNLWDSILPNCGPLVVINEEEPWEGSGVTVNLSYKTAVISGWATGYALDTYYYYPLYTGTSNTYTASFYITGRALQQFLVTGMVHQVTALTVTPELNITVQCMADNGVRMIYGVHSEKEREAIYKVQNGNWVSPKECNRCTGSRIYNGLLCPDCDGYGYVGLHAQDLLLVNQGKSMGITRIDESDESLAMRIWAKRWKMVPTPTNVKEFVSQFTAIDTGWIEIETNSFPECYYRVRLPIAEMGTRITNLQEILDYTCPAGTSATIEPYYRTLSDESLIDLESLINSGMCMQPIGLCGINTTQFYGIEWGMDWFGENIAWSGADGFVFSGLRYCTDAGEISYTGGVFSGALETGMTNIFKDMSVINFYTVIYNDQPFTGVVV
jgi:hypothetical protein